MEFFRVFLKAPLCEDMAYYELHPEAASRIDPEPDRYLNSGPEKAAGLPEGQYYVTQVRRESVETTELIDIALELQKEGLWERLKLENKLYIRRLFEDGFPVFQLWRPVIRPGSTIGSII
jgi:hypothetical protein